MQEKLIRTEGVWREKLVKTVCVIRRDKQEELV